VLTVKPESSIIDAAQVMLEHKVSGLPVLDATGKLVGILTESDIFRMLVKSRALVGSESE
jgi:CBS domain-containing protein